MHTEKGCPITKNNIVLKKRDGGRELMQVDLLQEECNVLTTKLIKLPLSYIQMPSRNCAFLPETIFHMQDNILSI